MLKNGIRYLKYCMGILSFIPHDQVRKAMLSDLISKGDFAKVSCPSDSRRRSGLKLMVFYERSAKRGVSFPWFSRKKI